MKVRMAIYNLKGKASIWWHELKLDKGLKENKWNGNILRNNIYLKAITDEKPKNFMS